MSADPRHVRVGPAHLIREMKAGQLDADEILVVARLGALARATESRAEVAAIVSSLNEHGAR